MSRSASAVSIYREHRSRVILIPYRSIEYTLCHQIQLLHQQRLVLCPSKVKGLGGHELGNAMFSKDSLVRQLGDSVKTAVLESRKAGLYDYRESQ